MFHFLFLLFEGPFLSGLFDQAFLIRPFVDLIHSASPERKHAVNTTMSSSSAVMSLIHLARLSATTDLNSGLMRVSLNFLTMLAAFASPWKCMHTLISYFLKIEQNLHLIHNGVPHLDQDSESLVPVLLSIGQQLFPCLDPFLQLSQIFLFRSHY